MSSFIQLPTEDARMIWKDGKSDANILSVGHPLSGGNIERIVDELGHVHIITEMKSSVAKDFLINPWTLKRTR